MITIGQSPRPDVISEIFSKCKQKFEHIERGVLDPFTYEEVIAKFSPNENSFTLVTKMKDGRQIRVCRDKIHSLIQSCITELEQNGCDAIILLCTGTFPNFQHSVPLFKPCTLLRSITSELIENGPIGVIVSEQSQIERCKDQWINRKIQTVIVAASPYGDLSDIEKASQFLVDANVSIIILDSIGFSQEMKQHVRKITGRPVLCSRTMVGRILEDL